MNEDDTATVVIEPPYIDMLHELREEHGSAIDDHIQTVVRDAIHESYKELDSQ
jgi:hypothetical protein